MNPLFLHSVSYIYWDPNPKLFLIPILEHPIMWYGMFFVIGFLGGYLILRHQFYHMLLTQQPSFQEQSFRRLDQLVFAIQKAAFTNDDPLHIVFKQLDKKTQQILLEWKVKENLPDSLVKPLLKALNQTILSSSFNKSLSFANCSKYTFHIEEILKRR